MSVTFIGDVHGQMKALEDLLPKCQGHLVFMGDLIDRGPDSKEVVACVRSLCAEGRASCILGNHEFALVSSLGLPDSGLEAKPHFFSTWCQIYGGFNTLVSYQVKEVDLNEIRSLLMDDLQWMYSLPWYLEGEADGKRYLAIHAGFNDREPMALQLAALNDLKPWWDSTSQLPPTLYEHKRSLENPPDLPLDLCVVSGHTVQKQVYIDANRILCDTSGGRPDRELSGVIWPAGEIITAATTCSAYDTI